MNKQCWVLSITYSVWRLAAGDERRRGLFTLLHVSSSDGQGRRLNRRRHLHRRQIQSSPPPSPPLTLAATQPLSSCVTATHQGCFSFVAVTTTRNADAGTLSSPSPLFVIAIHHQHLFMCTTSRRSRPHHHHSSWPSKQLHYPPSPLSGLRSVAQVRRTLTPAALESRLR